MEFVDRRARGVWLKRGGKNEDLQLFSWDFHYHTMSISCRFIVNLHLAQVPKHIGVMP